MLRARNGAGGFIGQLGKARSGVVGFNNLLPKASIGADGFTWGMLVRRHGLERLDFE